jgi:hypothetical protein
MPALTVGSASSVWAYGLAAALAPAGKPLSAALMELENGYRNACPQCGKAMRFVGPAFNKAPKHKDIRSWKRLKAFYIDSRGRRPDAKSIRMKHHHPWYMI